MRDVVIVEDGTPAAGLQTAQPAEDQPAAASGQLSLNVQGLRLDFYFVATMRLIKHLIRGSRGPKGNMEPPPVQCGNFKSYNYHLLCRILNF